MLRTSFSILGKVFLVLLLVFVGTTPFYLLFPPEYADASYLLVVPIAVWLVFFRKARMESDA